MVISKKMSENEMDYRGSKSKLWFNKQSFVKEQRVDGSYFGKSPKLRCTLMGFERNYPFKIPSKQLIKQQFTTLIQIPKINPWVLTGFADAEGCFTILVQPNNKYNTNYRVKAIFTIDLHKKDLELLENIKNAFGVGTVRVKAISKIEFRVESVKELSVIINHFDKYPLVTKKISDYLIFKQCFEMIQQGEHLNENGLLKIISLKNFLNRGLPENLTKDFPNLLNVHIPAYVFNEIPNPFWIAGFTSGDGSFHLKIGKSATTSIGVRVQLRFSIILHIRELEVIKGLAKYFNLLIPLTSESENISDIRYKNIDITIKTAGIQVTRLSDITDIIIPFFNKYPILGKRSLDFEDFKKVSQSIQNKEHLTAEGFDKIIKIKEAMNHNRK
jgi:hypothetical protein